MSAPSITLSMTKRRTPARFVQVAPQVFAQHTQDQQLYASRQQRHHHQRCPALDTNPQRQLPVHDVAGICQAQQAEEDAQSRRQPHGKM